MQICSTRDIASFSFPLNHRPGYLFIRKTSPISIFYIRYRREIRIYYFKNLICVLNAFWTHEYLGGFKKNRLIFKTSAGEHGSSIAIDSGRCSRGPVPGVAPRLVWWDGAGIKHRAIGEDYPHAGVLHTIIITNQNRSFLIMKTLIEVQ